MATIAQAIDKMTAFAERQTTPALCDALRMAEAEDYSNTRTEDGRAANMSRMVIIEALTARHPEADAAFNAWAAQRPSTETAAEAIIRAALDAACTHETEGPERDGAGVVIGRPVSARIRCRHCGERLYRTTNGLRIAPNA
ncbi:MAG TPA: hypothetical protein VGL93_10660 [Streptosporangiaceae bacterium]|jgi:hypothetical protein